MAEARIDVVDQEARELAPHLGQVGGAPVPLADHAPRLARALVLQLARGHDDRLDAELAERELCLEALALPLAAPDAEDERDACAHVKGAAVL